METRWLEDFISPAKTRSFSRKRSGADSRRMSGTIMRPSGLDAKHCRRMSLPPEASSVSRAVKKSPTVRSSMQNC